MSTSDHSSLSSYEKETFLISTTGSHKVRYNPNDDWDFHMDVPHKPIDLSLILPHYRARYQPTDHRMCLFVGGDSQPMKLKVCRNLPRSKFYLRVQALTSDVTVWLPSDFSGRICCSTRAAFSAGFVNRIMRNVRFDNDADHNDSSLSLEDEVIIVTQGNVSFRMWDIQTYAPENVQKETFRRMFGCTRKAPETTIDWDFLLEG